MGVRYRGLGGVWGAGGGDEGCGPARGGGSGGMCGREGCWFVRVRRRGVGEWWGVWGGGWGEGGWGGRVLGVLVVSRGGVGGRVGKWEGGRVGGGGREGVGGGGGVGWGVGGGVGGVVGGEGWTRRTVLATILLFSTVNTSCRNY